MTDFRQAHPDGVIVAFDQMSLYFQATTTRVWAPIGQTPIVKTAPQRALIHFYGAVNVLNGQEIALSTPEKTAAVTVWFLQHLLDCYPDRPILLLWDRAPWHQAEARQFVEAHPRLEALKFPVACPDLNPQEHVWNQARDNISHNHTFTEFGDLRQAFQDYLDTTTFDFQWADKYLPSTLCHS